MPDLELDPWLCCNTVGGMPSRASMTGSEHDASDASVLGLVYASKNLLIGFFSVACVSIYSGPSTALFTWAAFVLMKTVAEMHR